MTKEWKYLYSEPFKARYAIAAYYLRNCPMIIEIGGYKTPISEFVSKDKIVHVIDPKTSESHIGNFHHFSISFQNYNQIPNISYGMAILGLELHLYDADWLRLFNYIKNSIITVIEVPVEHCHSVDQFNKILSNTGKKVKNTIKLDLYENDFGDLTNSAPPKCKRNIYIL